MDKLRDSWGRGAAWVGGWVAAAAMAGSAQAGVVDAPGFDVPPMVIVIGASNFLENGGEAPIVGDFYLLDGASGTVGSDLIAGDQVTTNINTNRANPSPNGEESAWRYQIQNPTFGGNFISAGPHQVLNEDDAYTAFGLDASTDVDLLGGGQRASQFFVASNTAFDIHAEATDLVNTGAFAALDYGNIRYRLRYRVTGGPAGFRWGQRAQDPAPGAGNGITFSQSNNPAQRWTLQNLSSGPVKVFDGTRRTAAERGTILQHAVSFQSRYNLVGAGINGNNYDLSMGAGVLGATVTYTVYSP